MINKSFYLKPKTVALNSYNFDINVGFSCNKVNSKFKNENTNKLLIRSRVFVGR